MEVWIKLIIIIKPNRTSYKDAISQTELKPYQAGECISSFYFKYWMQIIVTELGTLATLLRRISLVFYEFLLFCTCLSGLPQ